MTGSDGPNVTDRVVELTDQIAKDIAPRMLPVTLGPLLAHGRNSRSAASSRVGVLWHGGYTPTQPGVSIGGSNTVTGARHGAVYARTGPKNSSNSWALSERTPSMAGTSNKALASAIIRCR